MTRVRTWLRLGMGLSLPALVLLTVLGGAESRAQGVGTGAGKTPAACFPGSYLVREGSGTQSLWTFSQDGTFHASSSAAAALSFGHIHGAWKKTGARDLRAVGLDFTFNGGGGGAGVPPQAIARVDAAMSFAEQCEVIWGSLEVRFFQPDEDPLTGNGTIPLSDTMSGRRVTVD